MHPLRIALTCLGAGAPLLGYAQVVEPAPQPKLYAGLAAYVSTFQSIDSWQGGFPVPLQAALGYQLLPRLAVQASVAYQGRTSNYNYTARDYYNGGVGLPYAISENVRYRALSAALLTRLTLTRQATHRLQFDLLGGFTLERLGYSWHTVRTDSAAAPVASSNAYHRTGLFITAGPGLRYRCGPRLEVNYNWLFSTNLVGFDSRSSVYYGTSSMALGVQYHFGRH